MWGQVAAALGSVAGGLIGAKSANSQANKNIKLQKEFAKTGIRWKVEDAKKAGIHPLYALGANTHSFSPVNVGDGGAAHFAQAGQDIGRAIDATRTDPERVGAYTKTVQQLSLQRMGLENQILASQLAKVRQAGQPPARPTLNGNFIDGQGNTPTKNEPQEVTPGRPGALHQAHGINPDTSHLRTIGGSYPVPSKPAKDAMEDNIWHQITHTIRNNILPAFGPKFHSPEKPAPYGHYYFFDPIYGYQLKKYRNYGPHKYHPARGAGKWSEKRLTHW